MALVGSTHGPRSPVLLAQDGPALGTRERFTFAHDAGAEMPAAGADAQAAAPALGIRRDLAAAVVGHEHGLVGRRPAVRLLAHAAPLAGPVVPKRAVGENRLPGTEVLAAAALRTRERTTGLPLPLPLGGRIRRNRLRSYRHVTPIAAW